MKKNEIVIQTLNNFKLPTYEEIPNVGLYLDQVTKYINSFLEEYDEMNVTPSMISNYVKLKLISKANKKTYSRDQIAGFIFIVFAKTVLSMNHIQYLLRLQQEKYSTKEAYSYFRDELLKEINLFCSNERNDIGEEKVEEKRMLHYVVVTIAHKMYLDCYFRETEVSKD